VVDGIILLLQTVLIYEKHVAHEDSIISLAISVNIGCKLSFSLLFRPSVCLMWSKIEYIGTCRWADTTEKRKKEILGQLMNTGKEYLQVNRRRQANGIYSWI